ncbi:hypothetical protein [Pseudomonas monteilii]|uniref:hypothetical protein n=1 Tax=Pseudomonas monteilii TaxID=76759 RepID=UPI003F6DD31B
MSMVTASESFAWLFTLIFSAMCAALKTIHRLDERAVMLNQPTGLRVERVSAQADVRAAGVEIPAQVPASKDQKSVIHLPANQEIFLE